MCVIPTLRLRSCMRGLICLAILLGCGDDVTAPGDSPTSSPRSLSVFGFPSTASPGDTLDATVSVRAANWNPIPEATVRLTVSDDGVLLDDRIVTDSLGRAHTGWILGRAPEQQIRAQVDSLVAAATVRVVPLAARLEIAPEDTVVTSLSDSLPLRVQAWDRDGLEIPVPTDLTLNLVSETRAVSSLPVVTGLGPGAVLGFAGPGTATVTVASGDAVSGTATVTVSPAGAIVDRLAPIPTVAAGDEVILRGYRLDYIGSDAVQVDGAPAAIIAQDSATLRFAVPERDLSACEGMARAPVAVADARVLESLTIFYLRPEALHLEVGDAVRLGAATSQCLILPGGPDAEYALLYFDTRAVLASETAPEEEGQYFQLFDLEIADWSHGAPTTTGTIPTAVAPPVSGIEPVVTTRQFANTGTGSCDFWQDAIEMRTAPLQVGDTVAVFLDGEYPCGRVVRIYANRFPLIVLDRDSLQDIPNRLSEVDAAMEVVKAYGVPAMERALSANFPETGWNTGQLPMVIATWAEGGAPAFWSGSVMAFRDWGSPTEPVYLHWWVIVHEMAHAWQQRHLRDVCESDGLCGGGPRGRWGGEGVASFLTEETGRRMTGAAIDANVGTLEYAQFFPAIRTSNTSVLFGHGYGSSSWFLRDLVTRAVLEGIPEGDAVRAVARGATEGWYGHFVDGPTREGLVRRMSTLLGRTWDPVDALLTAGISLAMDDLTDSPVYRYPAYRRAWEIYPPMATIGRDTTAVLSGVFYGSSFGYVRLTDGGRGGSYRFGASAQDIEWMVGRTR